MKQHPETILIVDDQPENLQVLLAVLAPLYRVLVARDGENAVAVASRQFPQLILLDVLMPGMDGFETCRRLKADPHTRETPVIFVTGLNEVSDESKGFEAGAVDYITKPVSAPILLARVATHLALYGQKRKLAAILNGTPVGIVSVDSHMRIMEANPAMRQIMALQGVTLADGEKFDEHRSQCRRQCAKAFHRTFSTQAPVKNYHADCSEPGKPPLVLEINTSPLIDQGGGHGGLHPGGQGHHQHGQAGGRSRPRRPFPEDHRGQPAHAAAVLEHGTAARPGHHDPGGRRKPAWARSWWWTPCIPAARGPPSPWSR